MAQNIAVRRAAKAQRRKTIVAQKRKSDIETGSTAGQIRLAVATPIQHCLLSSGLFGTGMGSLVLARGATPYNVTTAVFLLDTLALGIKDVFIRPLGDREFAGYVDRMSILTPMVPVEPSYARKLLHDLEAWARTIGVAPHRDYAGIERLFGTTDPAACDAAFEFDLEGKPVFVGDLSDMRLEPPDTDEFTIEVVALDPGSLEHDAAPPN